MSVTETFRPKPTMRPNAHLHRSELRRVWQRFKRNRSAIVGLVILLLLVGMSAASSVTARYDPDKTSLVNALQRPSIAHWMGTDQLGRDVWTRVIYGGRVSLFASVAAVAGSLAVGVPLGIVGGYWGRIVDTFIMRCTDIMLAFPPILLALSIAAAMGSGLGPAIVAAVVVSVPSYVRIARADTLVLRESVYVEAARAIGAGNGRIIRSHIVPNMATTIVVQATLQLASVLLLIASLGFLGLGVQPPTSEWGTMVADGRSYLRSATYLTALPGGVLILAVLAFNLVGDGLRDGFDVRSKI